MFLLGSTLCLTKDVFCVCSTLIDYVCNSVTVFRTYCNDLFYISFIWYFLFHGFCGDLLRQIMCMYDTWGTLLFWYTCAFCHKQVMVDRRVIFVVTLSRERLLCCCEIVCKNTSLKPTFIIFYLICSVNWCYSMLSLK